ncbi:MAG: hypothetical protein H0T46_05945 [Deltaproteobacteria bacterium]|nr:hypothetical protein [Deltaproteobacteria bacterium]
MDAIIWEGAAVTVMTRIDWSRPQRIPAIEAPARLPAGLGASIMNLLAERARDAGIPALRYAGPYPTSALYQALLRSFRTTATEEEFTRDALDRAVRGAVDELPYDFVPAPHARRSITGGHVELRDGLERAVIHGVAFARGQGITRLAHDNGGVFVHGAVDDHVDDNVDVDVDVVVHAEVWFGDRPWARVATLSPGGELVDGPHPLPRCESAVIGKTFPPALRDAIADLVTEAVPAPLATDARALLIASQISWADLGARAARRTADGFEVHAALWERLAPVGLARVALALAEALAPVVAAAIIADVALR